MPRRRKAKEEEEVYHVEVITKARVSNDGDSWDYFVKWAGYDSDADSWEPSDNVKQCNRLLASFWKHVGTDDNDYPIGYEVAAAESWINKEKRYFAQTFVKPSKQKSDKVAKGRRQSQSSVSESTVDDSSSSDEALLARTAIKTKVNKKTRIVDSESEFESDSQSRKQVTARPKASIPSAVAVPKVPLQAKRPEALSAGGSSLLPAPPKAPPVRTHQEQRANPLVKSMDLPSKSVEAGSLLSTKQRIAAGILPPSTGPKPLPPGPKRPLSSLSFKKNKPPILPTGQVKDATVPSASVPKLSSPIIQSSSIIDDANVVASPQPMDIDHPVDLFDSLWDDAGPLDKSSEVYSASIPLKSQEEFIAEEFLKTVDIPMLSGSLGTEIIDQVEHSTTKLPKTVVIPRIPKKWKWSGDLFISTSEEKTELLCGVTIADPGNISNSSQVNLLLSKLDSLQISRLYSIMDLSPLLRACGKPQYFGKLESNEPSDVVILDGLELYLVNEGLAAIIPLLHDNTEAAVLVVFPIAQQGLTKVLQVPEHLLSGTSSLLVMLLPFQMPNRASTNATGWRSIGTIQQFPYNLLNMPYDLSQEVVVYQAMFLLNFPKKLLDFLNNTFTSRSYSIWPTPNQLSLGLDTTLLQFILKSTKAVSAKIEEDTRVVFIPNKHLDVLYAMPSLVTKRVNSPEVQFWTYGYSPDMSCMDWRVHEIYPLGGIVTFTASALIEDLVGCNELISQIIEHPLWDCYLIPEVLAASHWLYDDGNISTSSESYLSSILDLIDLGMISAMRMPEKGKSNQAAWVSQVFQPSSASGHEILQIYLGALKDQHAPSMASEQLITFTNKEIAKDLLNAQIQPALMEKYRRFVVIRATSENAIPCDQDGLEWSSLSQFDFKDDYFRQ